MMPRRWRCAASPWRSSAIWRARRDLLRRAAAPSGRQSPRPAPAAPSPRPRSRWSPATLAGHCASLARRARRWPRRATGRNAAHAGYLDARRLLLIGRARRGRGGRSPRSTRRHCRPPRARGMRWSSQASRCGASGRARPAPHSTRAARAARETGIPALMAEVARARSALDAPAARLIGRGGRAAAAARRGGGACSPRAR